MRTPVISFFGALVLFLVCAGPAHPDEVEGEEVTPLEEVLVTAPAIVEERWTTSYGKRIHTVGEEQIEALNAQDLTSALRRVPGVVISRYNLVGSYGGGDAGAVFIRGHGSSRPGSEVATMVDGIPRFVGVWSHPLIDIMSLDIADHIDVLKSAEPVLYGNMSFGGINVIPKRRRKPGFATRLSASYGSHETGAYCGEHAGKAGAFDYLVSASYRRSDGHRRDADGEVRSVYAHTGLELGEGLDATLLFLHTDSWANDPEAEDSPRPPHTEEFRTNNEFYVFKVHHDSAWGSGSVKLYYEDGHNDWNQWDFDGSELFDTITEYENYGIRLQETLWPWDDAEAIVGLDHDLYGGKTREEHPSESSPWSEERFRNTAPYLLLSQTIGDFTPSAGVRYNDSRHFGGEWGLQAGLVIDLGSVELHADYARAFNLPGVYAAVQYELWNRGDEWRALGPETIDHYEAGIVWRVTPQATVDLTLFSDRVEDALRFVPPPPPPPLFKNIGEYETRGVEVAASYSPMEAASCFLGITHVVTDPDDIPNAPRWTVSAGLSWNIADDLHLDLDAEYVDSRYVLNPRYAAGQERVGSHFLVNGRLSYVLSSPEPGIRTEVFLALDNILNEDYEFRPGYPMPGTTVSGGIKIEF